MFWALWGYLIVGGCYVHYSIVSCSGQLVCYLFAFAQGFIFWVVKPLNGDFLASSERCHLLPLKALQFVSFTWQF